MEKKRKHKNGKVVLLGYLLFASMSSPPIALQGSHTCRRRLAKINMVDSRQATLMLLRTFFPLADDCGTEYQLINLLSLSYITCTTHIRKNRIFFLILLSHVYDTWPFVVQYVLEGDF